jgi:phospholipid/cholesterol/gamma-HCH transport system substrate-binding protein
VSSRDSQIADLLANARQLTTTLANSNDDFEKLIGDGNLLLTELNNRRDAIHQLLVGSQRLGDQISGLLQENQGQLAPALSQLHQVTDLLRQQNDNLAKSLQLAGPYFRLVNDTAGNGHWIDSYLCGLIPENRDPCRVPGGGR